MFSTPRKPLTKSLLPRGSHPTNHIPTITLAADEDDDVYLSTCSSSTLSSASSSSPSPMAQKRRSPPPSPPPRKKVVIEISDEDEDEDEEDKRAKELKEEAPPPSPLQKRPRAPVPVPIPAAVPAPIQDDERAVVRARLDTLFTHIAAGSSLATANRAITDRASPALPVPAERRPLKNTTTTTTHATTTAGAGVGTPKNPAVIRTSGLPRAKHEQQTSPAAVNIAPKTAVEVLADLRNSARPNAWTRPHTASRGLRAPLTSQLLAITSSPPFSISSTPAPLAVDSAQPAAVTTPKAVAQIVSSSPSFEIPSSPPPGSGTGLSPCAWIDKTGRSVQRLQIAIRRVLEEAGEDVVKWLAKELRHDWEVDEMAIYVEGYLRGALHEKIADGWAIADIV